MKIKSVHIKIFIFDSRKILNVKNKHFNVAITLARAIIEGLDFLGGDGGEGGSAILYY